MPISRPVLIALIAAVVALCGFYATQGSRNAADSDPVAEEVASTPAPKSVKPAKSEASQVAQQAKREVKPRRAERIAGVPAPVDRALRAHKLVVLFFYEPGSADDEGTARSVSTLRSRDVAVFTAPVGRLAKYRGLVGELGISQAPAVVIVKKNRSARVIEGYIDPATLAQDVADAR